MFKPDASAVDLPSLELRNLNKWRDDRTFYQCQQRQEGSPSFSFYDGPPFANGLPHYGHLLANTIKDVVPRYWSMKGFHVDRRFGWDCHGLPVEFEIEKRENLKGRTDIINMGVSKFNELCRTSVLHYADEWQRVITRLGRWVDWSNQYRTMDSSYMESVWWVFKRLYDMGLVYRGYKVVPYSPRITAVLSNFEANQNYKDVQDPALTVRFRAVDQGEGCYFLAWTTTPWTLTSNLALAVAPEVEYVKVEVNKVDSSDGSGKEVLILAKDRLDDILKLLSISDHKIVQTFSGSDLVGLSYLPPFPFFADHAGGFKVLAGDFVDTHSGTGIVHCAPAYGEDDNRVCLANQIELVDPLDEEARFTSQVPPYQGQYIKDADKAIIRDLKKEGLIFHHGTIVHSYPFCERTDEPLIYRSIPTWFVNVEAVKDQMIANNDTIRWVPSHLQKGRMGKWLENARDWAISRNRFWGTPIPIWICDQDDDHRFVPGSIQDLADRVNQEIDDIHKHKIDHFSFGCRHENCKGTMQRVSEVFDCWFESGSMPYAQVHYPFDNQEKFDQSFPADFIAEGLDQTRGWFYTLAVLSAALFKKPAFKNVVVNGLVLAEDGRKMSKRWRNYTDPEELITKYGADSVRLYMLNSAILRGEDLKFKDQGVRDTTRAVILPLWNAYSFLATYAHADNWQPEFAAGSHPPKVEGLLDRWIISKFQSLLGQVSHQMANYELYNVVPILLEFIDDLTNWYIRLSRRRFWAGEQKMAKETQDAYQTLFYVLEGFTKVFAPYAPFISESIYGYLHEGDSQAENSVHLCMMPEPIAEFSDESLEQNMAMVRRVTELGRSLRAKHQLKTRQVLRSMMVITKSESDRSFIDQTSHLIASELNLKDIAFSTEETKFVKLGLKPNLKILGKSLGKDLKAFRQHLDQVNQDQELVGKILGQIEGGGEYSWQGHHMGLDEFLIERGPKDHRLVASAGGVTVLLDTHLDDELIAEGLAREFINRIQNLRKDSGLEVSDRISLVYSTTDRIRLAVEANQSYILGEVLAREILFQNQLKDEFRGEETFDIDGEVLKVGLNLA